MQKVNDVVNRIVEVISIVIFIAMIMSIVLTVFARLTNNSLIWTDELSRYTFIWTVFLGTTIGIKNKSHIIFEMILHSLPKMSGNILNIVIQLFVIAVCAILFNSGVQLSLETWGLPTTAMRIPTGLLYVIIPLSSGLIIWYLIFDIINQIKSIMGKGKES